MPRCVAVGALLALLLSPGLSAKKKEHPNHGRDDREQRAVVFRSEHRRAVSEYYRAAPAGLPPGLAKRGGDLPPGLARQLQRRGHLPPGLEKKLVPFPVELDRRCPPLPPYYRRGLIGDRALVYDGRTGVIVDVFRVVVHVGR